MEKLPIFTSHYSYGKSIVTLEKKGSSSKTGADSIIDLCCNNNIKDLYLVEDNLSSFIQAYESCKDADLNLRYGLRLTMTNNAFKKDEESLKSNHKLIIFALNTAGYYKLLSIYSKAACDFKYYEPRMDYNILKELWSSDLAGCTPFYDSFLHTNNILGGNAIPDLFFDPLFFIEDNELPTDFLMKDIVKEFAKDKIQEVQSIFYKSRADFKAYNVFRCLNKRSILSHPKLDGFSSDNFCLENYLEKK